jgi:hypothetical protein
MIYFYLSTLLKLNEKKIEEDKSKLIVLIDILYFNREN